jgi:drug/metabolite transporter (DMT)-like permease
MQPVDLTRLLVLAALWGGSFIFMRVASPVLGPVVLIEARVLIAGLVLLAYATITRQQLDLRQHWRLYAMIGLLNSAIPFVLIATAQLHLTASLAATLNATSPLFGALIAALWLKDPLTRQKLTGIALGIIGVALATGAGPLGLFGTVLLSMAASLSAAGFYGLASTFTRRKASGAPPLGIAVGSQWAASVVLLPLIPIVPPNETPSATVIGCVLALAIFSTALAYVLYFRLIADIGPTNALTVTFLLPAFSMLWGVLFLNETVTLPMLIGCGVILVGTALVTGVLSGRVSGMRRLAGLDGEGV